MGSPGGVRSVDCGVCAGAGDLVGDSDEPNILPCHQCSGTGTVLVSYPDFESWHAVAADMLLLRDVKAAALLIAEEGGYFLVECDEYNRVTQSGRSARDRYSHIFINPQGSLASVASNGWLALLDESGKEVSYPGYSRQEFKSLQDVSFPASTGATSVVVAACALMSHSVGGTEYCRTDLPRMIVNSGSIFSIKSPQLTVV